MNRSLTTLIGLAATLSILAAWLVAVPFVSAGNPCFHSYEIPPATVSTTAQVNLEPCAFTPTVTKVAVGTLVTFKNGPTFSHLVTGAGQAWGDREVEIQPSRSVAYRFDEAGVFPYACSLHPGMSGVIVVGDAATTTGAGAATASTDAAAAPPPPVADGWPLLAITALAGIAGAMVGAAGAFAMRRPRQHPETPLTEAG